MLLVLHENTAYVALKEMRDFGEMQTTKPPSDEGVSVIAMEGEICE